MRLYTCLIVSLYHSEYIARGLDSHIQGAEAGSDAPIGRSYASQSDLVYLKAPRVSATGAFSPSLQQLTQHEGTLESVGKWAEGTPALPALATSPGKTGTGQPTGI